MSPIALEMIAPMLVLITLILTIGGVLILRPIATRLGSLLEVMTRERLEPGNRQEVEYLRDHIETLTQRLALMEERQEFTDRLLAASSDDRRSRLAPAPNASASGSHDAAG